MENEEYYDYVGQGSNYINFFILTLRYLLRKKMRGFLHNKPTKCRILYDFRFLRLQNKQPKV